MIHINVRIIDHYGSFAFREIGLTGVFVRLEACLCTTAKRDSLYDDPAVPLTKNSERQSADHFGLMRTGKHRYSQRKRGCCSRLKAESLSFVSNVIALLLFILGHVIRQGTLHRSLGIRMKILFTFISVIRPSFLSRIV